MRSACVVTFTALCALVSSAAAQAPDDTASHRDGRIALGARVRVRTHPDSQRIDGTIRSVAGDMLSIEQGWEQPRAQVNLRELTSLEVYGRGKADDQVVGVLGGVGFVAGSAMYLRWCHRYREECRETERRERREREAGDTSITRFGVMAVGTALVGALLGYVLTPPRWQGIALPARVGVVPVRDGLALYVTLSFR